MAKLIAYLIYCTVFTSCYYGLNRKLSTKWVFILYPLIFCAVLYPINVWFDYARPVYGEVFTRRWLIISLMMFCSLTVFNLGYGAVNLIADAQVNFHQNHGNGNVGFIKSFIDNVGTVKGGAHFFFYTGAILTMYIAVSNY